jgi:hypothetical protein
MKKETIRLSAIEDKLSKAAFELFRLWTKEMGISTTVIIKNESHLVNDLNNAIRNGIHTLFTKKDRTTKSKNWQKGFLIGFISGNLGRKWYHEYIIKNSDGYKTLIGLKSLQAYLQFDELTSIKINQLYVNYLEHDVQFEIESPKITQLDFDSQSLKPVASEEKGQIEAILNNLIIQQIMAYTKKESGVDLKIEAVFSDEDIERLIDENDDTE